jgi:putative Ca2+/H+ antiporter (TMEM165/GDT1 family)
LEAFFVSAAVVAVGEIGDKTQLLALLLAARFRRPIPILLGILVATLLNHSLAALLGEWIRTALSPQVLRWSLAVSFLAIAALALKPDKLEPAPRDIGGYGAFAFTALAFFLAEFGDKTQLATIALAAHFGSLVTVVAGTTTGMLIADAPVVFLARKAAPRIPFTTVRYVAAALFAALGLVAATGLQLRF